MNKVSIIIIICFFVFIEWIGKKDKFALENLVENKFLRYTFYLILSFMVYMNLGPDAEEFIYFQF